MFLSSWLSLLQEARAIAVIRAHKKEQARQMAIAIAAGGMRLIEITWNSEGSAELIAQLRNELPECTIGTGTLLNLAQQQQAIAAGAQFLFSPHLDVEMIQSAVQQKVPMIPGALSPTEIVTAYTAGASCVKVFPVQALGGVNYIKSLQAPLGHIPLIPTGGVTVTNAPDFINAGAIAVGLASELFPKQLLQAEDWYAIATLAKALMQTLNLK